MIVHHDDMQIMCVCSCICTVAHGYSQLYEGLKVHRPAQTCICAPARTFHGTNKLATTELQYTQRLYPLLFLQRLAVIPVDLQRLYPAVITVTCFLCKTSGYNRSWPCIGYTAVIPNGYNRYLFFMVNQITIRSRAVITASTSGCTCLHAFTCAYLCVCLSACLHTFVYV